MTRLDKLAIVITLALIIGFVLGHLNLPADAPDIGRRPLAPPQTIVPGEPPQSAAPLEPAPARVRRPLPEPSPSDPTISVNAEAIPPDAVGIGTSFPVGSGLWLTARHVANAECQQVLVVVGRTAMPAQIRYLHPDADLALLETQRTTAPLLPIANEEIGAGDTGYSFGFPHNNLGGFEATVLGRARMQLGGRLQGTAPVLAWAENLRFPETLEALQGISGGPMLDESGDVVGIMVAVSARRGRTFSVAPEILRQVRQAFDLDTPSSAVAPVKEVVAKPVSLGDTATAMLRDSRIVPTVCKP